MNREPSPRLIRPPGWDVLVVFALTFAVLQVTGLAESTALPTRVADVLRHPWLGGLLSDVARGAFGEVGPRPGEPIGLLLNAFTLACVILYALADMAFSGRLRNRIKWLMVVLVIAGAVYLPTIKLMLLRDQSGPASYSHDGGVIQTEETIRYLLEGRNPYTEDYVDTPMAEWGFGEYRTALYHYPYLPWTFIFSAPFFLFGRAAGAYDQRAVYLLLFAIALALAPRLVSGERVKLALVALLALNPIMALDVIFGQNDVFVLSWLIFCLVSWTLWNKRASAGSSATLAWATMGICFGLACASKPTAWFLAPFLALLVSATPLASAESPTGPANALRALFHGALKLWPAALVFGLLMLPYLLWDSGSLVDDVWRWSSGQGETGYQIWGWGASNFVLASGSVQSRFDSWPFWLLELVVAGPILVWFIRRQARANTLSNASWHYAILLFTFFFVSRFLNENYLGFVLAFAAIGGTTALSCELNGPLDERAA